MNPFFRIVQGRMTSLEVANWAVVRFKSNRNHRLQILLCGACILTYAALHASTNSTETATDTTNHCRQFTLEDQFEKTHEFKFPREKPTVLTVADKKGSKDIVGWAHPLAEKFGDKIIIAGLADVSSVPGPLRSLVLSKFKKSIRYPVMLDWEGKATRSFNYTKGKANVYLVSTDGRILLHLANKADAEKLEELTALIEHEIPPDHEAKARSH